MKRIVGGLVLSLAVSVGAAAATSTAASAAVHYETTPQVQSGWTDAATPTKAHSGGDDVNLPLGTSVDDDGVVHTTRVYVTYDLSNYEGKKVYGGTVIVQEQSAADCTKRSLELWQVKAVSSTPTWEMTPAALSKLDEIQTPEYCPHATIDFDVRAALADAQQHRQRRVTFELRVSADHETDPAYGRTLNGYRGVRLTTSFNSPPTVDKNNLFTSGFACTQLKPYPKFGGFAGRLQARVLDADDDRLTTEFAIWQTGDADTRTIYTADNGTSGRVASVTVPQTTLVQGKSYGWQARVNDGNETSPWSKKCFFTYDGIAPPAPGSTSPNFPENTWGPVSQNPKFVFDGRGDKDIAGFQYGWGELGVDGCEANGDFGQWVCKDPLSRPGVVKANTPGGTATVTLKPDSSGPIRLAVRALDEAGNISPTVNYTIYATRSEPTVELQSATPEWNGEVL